MKSNSFRLQACHLLKDYFPVISTINWFCNFTTELQSHPDTSHYPRCATLAGLHAVGFRLFPLRSPLLRESLRFLFLGVLRCFTSPRLPPVKGSPRITGEGLPHSDTRGSMVVCTYPRLFAACHVLLRLSVPRHPPYALSNLTLNLIPPYDRLLYTSSLLLYSFSILSKIVHMRFVELSGIEPLTSCVQGRRSPN